jgi:anti-sigma regulatory factor (Ser/Thr protein kinase)
LELLVSELATNAIRHAGGDRFMVEFDANGHVLVAICDADPTPPTARNAALTDMGGRGLAIVEGLSDRWGAQIHRAGKCVWFQVADPQQPRKPAEAPDIGSQRVRG